MSDLDDVSLVRAAQAGDVTGLGVLLERQRVCTPSRSASSATAPTPRTRSKMRA